VVVLVIDATVGATDQDAAIAAKRTSGAEDVIIAANSGIS